MGKVGIQYFRFFFGLRSVDFPLKTLFSHLIVLVLADTVVLFSASTLNGFSASQLIYYNIFAFPLWMFAVPRRQNREIPALVDSGRWGALGFIPAPAVTFFLGCHLVQVLKSFAFWIFVTCLLGFGIVAGKDPFQLMFVPLLIIIGICVLSLVYFACLLLSPKGHAALISNVVYFIFWLFSGAIVPLEYLMNQEWMYALNPVSFAVALPVSHVFLAGPSSLWPFVIVGLVWLVVLYSLALGTERMLVRKLYA